MSPGDAIELEEQRALARVALAVRLARCLPSHALTRRRTKEEGSPLSIAPILSPASHLDTEKVTNILRDVAVQLETSITAWCTTTTAAAETTATTKPLVSGGGASNSSSTESAVERQPAQPAGRAGLHRGYRWFPTASGGFPDVCHHVYCRKQVIYQGCATTRCQEAPSRAKDLGRPNAATQAPSGCQVHTWQPQQEPSTRSSALGNQPPIRIKGHTLAPCQGCT